MVLQKEKRILDKYKMIKHKITQYVALILLLIVPVSVFAQAPEPNFNPSKIIEDKQLSAEV